MDYKFSPEAQFELREAYLWYEEQRKGLGERFVNEVYRSVNLITMFPEAWRLVGKYTRKCLVNKFPYLILYTVEDDEVYITCIASQRRDPEIYRPRMI